MIQKPIISSEISIIPNSVEEREARWCAGLAHIIDHLESDELPHRLIGALAALVPFSMSTIIINRGRSRPICIFDTFPTQADKSGIHNYIKGTYVLNPFYRAHLGGLKQGVYRIGDLAPDEYFSSGLYDVHKAIPMPEEEIGYKTENWPKGFEELDIAVPIDDVTIEIGLYNSVKAGGFSDSSITSLTAKISVIGAIIRKYWKFRSGKLAADPRDSSIDEIFDNFCADELSLRECEVIRYVMRGHSSESIAMNLDISITTVKTHRKRAYAKLEISSQSELFSLFLDSMKSELQQQ